MLRFCPLLLIAAAGAAPVLGPVQLNPPSPRCRERLELTFDLQGRFDNPFDPREVAVDATFRGPNGVTATVPGFLYQDAERSRTADGGEAIALVGQPVWKVRFAPTKPGAWTVTVTARDRDGTVTSPAAGFQADPGTGHGYLRRAPGSRYFQYEDGTPILLIGQNLAWASRGGTYDFDRWLEPLPAAGANLVRVWLQWDRTLSLEYKGPRSGCGRYDLANAWRADHVLDECRRLGLHVLFTLDSPEPYQQEHYWLGKLTAKPWTDFCAHNVANGGTLAEPKEFYTTEEGRRLIRQRLRYIVARWGWDPNLFCWELWNELNCFPEWDKLLPEITAWHREMIAWVRGLDPNHHLITTSFGNAEGADPVWQVDGLDFTQSHLYQSEDMAEYARACRTMLDRYPDRPHLVGEFGTKFDWLSQLNQLDPDGVHQRNGIWASVMAGDAGTALNWCWAYLHDRQVYRQYTALAKYARDVPWTTAGFRPAELSLTWRDASAPRAARDLVLSCGSGANVPPTIALDPDNPPTGLGRFYLYGHAQQDQQRPITLQTRAATPGKLVLRIGKVWVKGVLRASLDGRQIYEREFPAGPGNGPWKRSELDPRWNIYGADYDEDVSLDLPAGAHQVALYNAGADGITIDRVTLTGYLSGPGAAARALGLTGRRLALVWVQNRDHCLRSLAAKQAVAPVAGVRLRLAGVPAGPCQVAWWDTTSGEVTKQETVTAAADGLSLDLPELAGDLALKVRW